MRRLLNLSIALVLLVPASAAAQIFQPLTGVVSTPSVTTSLPGTVEIVVEGETYTPSFYRGRAEPTVGNIVRLVAVPLGADPATFTYQWSVGGRALGDRGATAFFSDMFSQELQVSVNVIDSSGKLWARADQIVTLSRPQVVFYEENLLRGHGSRAIGTNHTLIGEEGVIRAEPYFVGKVNDPAAYRATWKVNGAVADSGGDWRKLLLQRPDSPLAIYRIEFNANNENNLAERVENGFDLNFGL